MRKVEGALESVGLAEVDGVNPYVVVDGVGIGVGGGEANEDDKAVDASSRTESRTLFRYSGSVRSGSSSSSSFLS